MAEICESKSRPKRAKGGAGSAPSVRVTTAGACHDIEKVIDSLLKDGKQPPQDLVGSDGGKIIADALAERLDTKGVQPSRAAHAMCGAAAKGSYAIVQMLAERPASTFNKAYNFSEPLRRACRSWVRETDPDQRRNRLLCAVALVRANADLDDPDRYLKNKQSAREAINSIADHKASVKFFADLEEMSTSKAAHVMVKMEQTQNQGSPIGVKRKRS